MQRDEASPAAAVTRTGYASPVLGCFRKLRFLLACAHAALDNAHRHGRLLRVGRAT